jgi:hypothetical protein
VPKGLLNDLLDYLIFFCLSSLGKTMNYPSFPACNPSYSGGRDQDCGLKPAQANSLRDPISKNPLQKGLVEWLKV